ncbi:MAG: hypothetical protein P4L42_11725 [Desulfocapsaceae bacterium]|nr:hypothetical protein [Desulfocapsaceae bacterium]
MGKEELVLNNPLRALGLEEKIKGDEQSMGLVMSRAGTGKTAILVQIALDSMLRGNKVLHVSIGESIDKARSWYNDILSLLTKGKKIENIHEVISEILRNRMIMTFKETSFSPIKLEERLDDIVKQNIYKPECLIIDGYDFNESSRDDLISLRKFMKEQGLKMVWFSAVSHREDNRVSADGVPAPCHEVDDLFETVLIIKPDNQNILLDIVKCASCAVRAGMTLALDPSTMLIMKA